jgi:hypothetical protein
MTRCLRIGPTKELSNDFSWSTHARGHADPQFGAEHPGAYIQQVSLFARHFNQSPERLGPEQIRAYQVYLTKEKKLATSSILIAVSALRFLYKITLKKDWTIEDIIPAPKSLRPCQWSSVPRKFYSFLPVWPAGSTVPS